MTVEEKLLAVARKLNDGTDMGKHHWEETASDSEFITSMTSYSVAISAFWGDNLGYPSQGFKIKLINKEGKTIESLQVFDNNSGFLVLDDLYTKARRSALGVENALDDLLTQLDGS